MNTAALILGLLVGNILYQIFFSTTANYGYALTLSFHQTAAIFAYKFMESV